MAKWHYRIESNQRIKGYNHKNGTHDYLIQDVVKIEENGKARFEKEYYQNGGKSKFVNIGLSCILMLILLIYAIRNVQVSMDIESTNVFSMLLIIQSIFLELYYFLLILSLWQKL